MKTDFFKDIKKEVLEIKDRNPQLSEDNAFIAWFLRAFISEDEKKAVDSLTGKSGDKGADAIYFDHENRLVFIIQGKYHLSNTFTEPRSHIIALADMGRSIAINRKEPFKALLNKANSTVKKLLEETRNLIHKRNYHLVLRYVTTAKISKTHIEEGESKFDDLDNVRFETFCFNDLMKLMHDYIEGAAPPVPTITLPVQGREVFLREDKLTKITSWIFTMSGNDIGTLFNNIGVRLFARNIRGFLGLGGKVNRALKNTIEKEPEFFWYYNNGITIVCDEAKQINKGSGNIMKVTNAQIINGQQTSRTLSSSGRNDAEVLVKLIAIPRDNSALKSKYSHLVTEIVSATNWQNAISQSDLKANEPEQVRIEKEFKKLNYFYIRKKMSKSESAKYGSHKFAFQINKDELSRSVAACMVDPYEVRLGKDRLFEDDIYYKIFNGRKVSEYLNIYWLSRKIAFWSRGDDRKVYAKWYVLNLLWGLLEKELKKSSYRDQFRKLLEREKKYQGELKPLNKLIKDSFDLSLLFYRKNKRVDGKIQQARDFYKHANYYKNLIKLYDRSPKYRNKIKKDIKQLLSNIDELNEQN